MKTLEEKYQKVLETEEQPVMTTTKSGIKQWRLNGELHRTDGPAIDFASGYKEWWINGKRYTEDKFKEYLNKLKEIEKGSKEAGANLDF